MSRLSVRPTASAVIAISALVVALGGSAYAAAKINGKNITKHSIAGSRLKSNTLTGAQIKESKLGKVPAAKTADSAAKATTATNAKAVNGNSISTFAATVAMNGVGQNFDVPGGVVMANCPSGGVNLDVAGSSDTGESEVIQGNDATVHAYFSQDPTLTTSSRDSLSVDAGTTGSGVAVITRGTAGVTTITFSYRSNSDQSCTYDGSVVASP